MSETDASQRCEEASNQKLLEMVLRKVTVLGRFSRAQMSVLRMHAWEAAADDLCYRLQTEMLCQPRGNQQQTVQFWVPTSWWQHLKHAIVQRCFGGWALKGFSTQKCSAFRGPRWWQWLGRRIGVKTKAVEKTVEWEVLDSYPKADVGVPEDFGEPVRIVIPQAGGDDAK